MEVEEILTCLKTVFSIRFYEFVFSSFLIVKMYSNQDRTKNKTIFGNNSGGKQMRL